MTPSLSRLYFITRDVPGMTHAALAERVCQAGVRLVQVRVKGRDLDEWTDIARSVLSVCRQYQALCIVNDRVDIALAIGADGVHLGAEDGDLERARESLGPNAIIGATVNRLEDCQKISPATIDYIGVGPYRFTTTKVSVNEPLGLKRLEDLIFSIKNKFPHLPLFAVGGVEKSDITDLVQIGMYGVAVSSALSGNEDIQTIAREMFSHFPQTETCV